MQNNNRHKKNHHQRRNERPKNKSLILIKSITFALFIVFVTLLVALFIAKGKKEKIEKPFLADCQKLQIKGEVKKIVTQNSNIIILIENKDEYKLIKLSQKCFANGQVSLQKL